MLDYQVAEKAANRQAEAADDAVYAQMALFQDQAMVAVEAARQVEDRQKEFETKDFSSKHLRRDMRREYALSDPMALQKDVPARVGNNDPRCGPASVQQFEGELLEKTGADKRAYMNQQKQWLLQQMAENEAAKNAERDADQQYDELVRTGTEVRGLLEAHAQQVARDNKMAEAEYNRQLAIEMKSRKWNAVQREADQVQAHVDNMRQSTRLSESVDAPFGLDGRVLRDEYKRISREAEQEVYNDNARLIYEKRQQRMAEKQEAAEEAEQLATTTAVLGAVEMERMKLEVERRRQLDAENSVIAQAQRNMRQHHAADVRGGEGR